MSTGRQINIVGIDPGVIIKNEAGATLCELHYEESWITFTLEDFFKRIVELAGVPLPNILRALFPTDAMFDYYQSTELVKGVDAMAQKTSLSFFELTRQFTERVMVCARHSMPARDQPGSFVNVRKKVINMKFDPDAPDWRVATKGINLEGKCTNTACKAYNQMVIYMHGYDELDFLKCTPRCPMCQSPFEAVLPGFTSCRWTIKFIDSEGTRGTRKERIVDEGYDTYPPDTEKVDYQMLHIIAKPLDADSPSPSPATPAGVKLRQVAPLHCCACSQALTINDVELPCGHGLHRACLAGCKVCPQCGDDVTDGGLPR